MKKIFQKIIGKLFVAQLYTTTVKLCLSNLPDYFNLSYRRKAVYTERCIADDEVSVCLLIATGGKRLNKAENVL